MRWHRFRLAAASLGLSAAVAACTPSVPQRPVVDYTLLNADTRAAYAALCAQADGLVAAGLLDPLKVAALEAQAQAALAALPPVPAKAARTAGAVATVDLAGLQTIARQVRLALTALAAIIPPAALPPAVAAVWQIASALLDAFIAMPIPAGGAVTLDAAPR